MDSIPRSPRVSPLYILPIIRLICSQLGDDLGSIYSMALTSHSQSQVALHALYSHLTEFPGDHYDEPTENNTEHTKGLRKWSSLWKSLAQSSLSSSRTTINYVAALRVLDLNDLGDLMKKFEESSCQTVRAKFFEKGLEEYDKTAALRAKQCGVNYWKAVAESLTDLIVRQTRNVRTLIGPTPVSNRLHYWLNNTSSLTNLQMDSGESLGDERVVRALQGCPNLESLSLNYWTHSMLNGEVYNHDELLARLLRCLARGLRSFIINKAKGCLAKSAISALSSHHGKTLTELKVYALAPDCLYALAASDIINLRSCALYVDQSIDWVESEEKLAALSDFLTRNRSLEDLDVGIPEIHKILGASIRNLQLKSLSVSDISNPIISMIASQALSLENLAIDNGFMFQMQPSFNEVNMPTQICLHKLRILTLSNFGDQFGDWVVGRIVENCPNIMLFSFGSRELSDQTLHHLSKLLRLQILHIM